MTFPPGWILYASTDHPDAIQEARDYIKREGLTTEQCRLIRVDGQIRVVAK